VIRTRRPGKRALAVGLAAAAIGCGTAAAAVPTVAVHVHARLAPVAGTAVAGRFDGTITISGGARETAAVPRPGAHWQLGWTITLPAIGGPTTASLQIHAAGGAGPVVQAVQRRRTTRASGTLPLTGSEALRVAGSQAVVVVHTATATLRGAVKTAATG